MSACCPAGSTAALPKGSGVTSIVEAVNCSLCQCCSVLVRKTCSFSKSLALHMVRIKIVIDNYNRILNQTTTRSLTAWVLFT